MINSGMNTSLERSERLAGNKLLAPSEGGGPLNNPRVMEWGDLYAGTGISAFEAHRAAAVSWLFKLIRESQSDASAELQP